MDDRTQPLLSATGPQAQGYEKLDATRGGVAGSVFTLANSAVGAGVLAFPVAFKHAGLLLGAILTACLAILMGFTLYVLVCCAEKHGALTYQHLVTMLVGDKAARFVEITMIVYLFGACVSYLIIIGDMFHPVFEEYLAGSILEERKFVISAAALLFVLPLGLLRDISSLKYSSAVAIFAIGYTAALVCYHGITYVAEDDEESLPYFHWDSDFFLAVPIVCFALQCHIQVIPIYAASKQRTPQTMTRVILYALAICVGLYIPVGALGYLRFGSSTPADVLGKGGFAVDDPWVIVARICVALTAISCYPLNHYPARSASWGILSHTFWTSHPSVKDSELPWKFHYGFTITFFLLAVLLSLFVPNISIVFDLLGSTAAVIVIFFFPAYFLWYSMEQQAWGIFIAAVGAVICVVSTTVTILNMT